MDYLKVTDTGGIPYNNDDFTWLENAPRDAIFGLFADLAVGTNTNFIISGCVATLDPGVDVSVTAGYIFLNGEVLEVEAQTVADSGTVDLYAYGKVTTYDTSGDKTTKDGGSISTYQKNRGVITAISGSVSGTQLDPVSGDRLGRKLDLYIPTQFEDWKEVGNDGGATTYIGNWAGYAASSGKKLAYRKVLGHLELLGDITNGNPGSSGSVVQLPVGYRPQQNTYFPTVEFSGTPTPKVAFIRSTGVIDILTVAANEYYSLPFLSIPLD